MEDELFYVGIRDPVELRKELLTSSKELIDALRRYEQYKDIKEQKLQFTIELKRVFDELLVLNKKLRGKLPRVPIKTPTVTRAEETQTTKKTSSKSTIKYTKSKIDVLEDELAKIEERLGSLD